MKKLILLILLINFLGKSFSQDSGYSIELNKPFSLGDDFFGHGYSGIADIGLKSDFFNFKNTNIGITANVGAYGSFALTYVSYFYTFQPRVFIEHNFEKIEKLHAEIGIGYSILYLKGFLSNSYHHGLQLNAGLSYDIRKRLFLKIQYDFINFKEEKEKTLEWANKNRDINILKLGIGFRF